MLKFQDDYTTLIATFKYFILLVTQLLMIFTDRLFLCLFRKGGTCIRLKCLIHFVIDSFPLMVCKFGRGIRG